jgi:large subunit ribosomal protein L23
MKIRPILIKPLYTEKMTLLQDSLNKYAFQVDGMANKIEIKKAVESKFEVKVKSVRIMNVNGKKKQQTTRYGRFTGRRANWKKAIVTLEAEFKLELFDHA